MKWEKRGREGLIKICANIYIILHISGKKVYCTLVVWDEDSNKILSCGEDKVCLVGVE